MAAADLGRVVSGSHSLRGSAHAWLITYAAIWALTLGCAAIVALMGYPVSAPVHRLLGLRLSPSTTPPIGLGRVFALAAHNIPIVSWPLLLGGLGAHHNRGARRVADGLVLASVVVNVAPVGAALGAYGLALAAYVPQLPLEWGALAVGAGSWLQNRRRATSFKECLGRFAVVVCLLLCAAVVEAGAVPHR